MCDAGGKPIAGHKAANLSDYRTNSNPSAFSYGEPEHRKRTARSDGDEDHWGAVRSPAYFKNRNSQTMEIQMNPDDITPSPVFVIKRVDDACPDCGSDQLLYDDNQALIEFRSRYEAIKFALEELAGVTIEKLEPKRGSTHFE